MPPAETSSKAASVTKLGMKAASLAEQLILSLASDD